ncbi:MAG: aldo/keto reductase [Clostridiales bacterium]|jgi:aryl-alcohol dehydrogenase-like predicted oxidoreductase|nr:aldo/keto reductase [Clostridiales bacterium]
MEQTIFGKTGLTVGRTGFGCIPIQRVTYEESSALLRRAYGGGVTLFDTANGYTTSEDRIGTALSGVRDRIVLCTKSAPLAPERIAANIDNSLKMMRTDYIDVIQVHNPGFVPKPGGEDGVYDCLLKAKKEGKIRHIGITNHSKDLAKEAVLSGLYDTLQYPLSYLSSDDELELVRLCEERNIGFLAMKALCGGLLTNAKAAFAFLRQFKNVIPIWGIQHMAEIDEFLEYEEAPPILDDEMLGVIEADKAALAGNFCRSCGYCLPCPAGIPIPNAARVTMLLGRTVKQNWTTPEWQAEMRKIDGCTGCGGCKSRCPYGLDIPALLKLQQKEYFRIVENG